jgi:hypothetical protein|tara:strand:- start:73 stop:483 length:411 start_codon:yes stop_codon:yes gene_type:complete
MMGIEEERFDYWWDKSKPFVQDALDRDGGSYTVDDVLQEIKDDKALFYPVRDGASVFRVISYPQKRMLRIWLVGGDMSATVDGESVVSAVLNAADYHAHKHNCAGVELEGRKGWEKVLKPYGFEHKRIVLVKELEG